MIKIVKITVPWTYNISDLKKVSKFWESSTKKIAENRSKRVYSWKKVKEKMR